MNQGTTPIMASSGPAPLVPASGLPRVRPCQGLTWHPAEILAQTHPKVDPAESTTPLQVDVTWPQAIVKHDAYHPRAACPSMLDPCVSLPLG